MGLNLSEQSLRDIFVERVALGTVMRVCRMAADDDVMIAALYRLTKDVEHRVATNALWVLTHIDCKDDLWLMSKRKEFIDRVLYDNLDATSLRLLLTLLLRSDFPAEDVCAEFVDFCLEHTCASSQPYAIRALCMKLAYKQCCHYPELLSELKSILEAVAEEPLSAGLLSAHRQVMKKINNASRRKCNL